MTLDRALGVLRGTEMVDYSSVEDAQKELNEIADMLEEAAKLIPRDCVLCAYAKEGFDTEPCAKCDYDYSEWKWRGLCNANS